MTTEETRERWLTVPEVARRLSIGRERAYELVKQGRIPAKRMGERRIRVSSETLIAFMNDQPDYVPPEIR